MKNREKGKARKVVKDEKGNIKIMKINEIIVYRG